MHQSVTCTQCHIKPVFTNVGQRCQDCHADIHKRQLGANCEQCHTVRGWNGLDPADAAAQQPLPADRRARGGGLRLLPQRRGQQPVSDDVDGVLFLPRRRLQAARPIRITSPASSRPPASSAIGRTTGSKPSSITPSVGFPLTGGHAVPPRQCADCHINNNYKLTSTPAWAAI